MSSNLANNNQPASNSQQEKKAQRLFFALWPEDSLRQQIKRHCKTMLRHGGGRPVRLDNIHFTLAFLGNVTTQQRACVEQLADQIQAPSFAFTVDVAGYFPKPRVLWVGPQETPEVMVTLATALRDGAVECGIQMDMRPYRAHMTLMRKVARPSGDFSIHPFNWQADRFVLVKSVTYREGVQYDVIKEWALTSKTA